MSSTVTVRHYHPADAAAVTGLVHLAYAELAQAGMNFTAADQDIETTRQRAAAGMTLLAETAGRLLACVTITYPPSRAIRKLSSEARREKMAWLNQLAVDPGARGQGLASRLWQSGAAWAASQGATHIGLDTAVPAGHLRAMYSHWGFADREVIHWPGKTYDSVVMVTGLADVSGGIGGPQRQPED